MFKFCKVSPAQNDLTVKTASLLFTESSFQCFSLHSEYLPSAHPFHLLLYSDYVQLVSLILFHSVYFSPAAELFCFQPLFHLSGCGPLIYEDFWCVQNVKVPLLVLIVEGEDMSELLCHGIRCFNRVTSWNTNLVFAFLFILIHYTFS